MTQKTAFHVTENDFMSPRKSTFWMNHHELVDSTLLSIALVVNWLELTITDIIRYILISLPILYHTRVPFNSCMRRAPRAIGDAINVNEVDKAGSIHAGLHPLPT